jgi:hypothetical protein
MSPRSHESRTRLPFARTRPARRAVVLTVAYLALATAFALLLVGPQVGVLLTSHATPATVAVPPSTDADAGTVAIAITPAPVPAVGEYIPVPAGPPSTSASMSASTSTSTSTSTDPSVGRP